MLGKKLFSINMERDNIKVDNCIQIMWKSMTLSRQLYNSGNSLSAYPQFMI